MPHNRPTSSSRAEIQQSVSRWAAATVARSLSCAWLSVTPWTAARWAPLSMGIPRQEYWSRLPFPSPGYLPGPWIELTSPAVQADPSPELPGKPRPWAWSATTSWYLDPVLPLAGVLLVSRQPPHPTFPVAHVVLPLTLVYVPGLVTRTTNQTIKTSYLMFICL